jgi:hypothetical protein
MGVKTDQIAAIAGTIVEYGASQTVLVVGDNTVVPTVPAGKTRLVSLVLSPNATLGYNYDNTSHDIFYKIGTTTISMTVTVPSGSQSFLTDDNFNQLTGLALAAGEHLVLNLAGTINIAGSVTASFSWFDVDATVFGAPRVNIPDSTPVVIVGSPPAGKARRVGTHYEGLDAECWFFNGDAGSVGLTVEVASAGTPITSNVLDVNSVTILSGRGFRLSVPLGISGNQTVRAYLDTTPTVPLACYVIYQQYTKTA